MQNEPNVRLVIAHCICNKQLYMHPVKNQNLKNQRNPINGKGQKNKLHMIQNHGNQMLVNLSILRWWNDDFK
jgi:hypothetical protein